MHAFSHQSFSLLWPKSVQTQNALDYHQSKNIKSQVWEALISTGILLTNQSIFELNVMQNEYIAIACHTKSNIQHFERRRRLTFKFALP